VLGLPLAAIGPFSAIAHSVSSQTREIGIWIAVGQRTRRTWMARKQGLIPSRTSRCPKCRRFLALRFTDAEREVRGSVVGHGSGRLSGEIEKSKPCPLASSCARRRAQRSAEPQRGTRRCNSSTQLRMT
jgi:hypothetical protein